MHKNVAHSERIISTILGSLALWAGARSTSRLKAAAQMAIGGSLISRGVSGHCSVYKRLNINTVDHSLLSQVSNRFQPAQPSSVVINRPLKEVQELLGGYEHDQQPYRVRETPQGDRTILEAVNAQEASGLIFLKASIEAGEIPRVRGQSHGRRSFAGQAIAGALSAPQIKIKDLVSEARL